MISSEVILADDPVKGNVTSILSLLEPHNKVMANFANKLEVLCAFGYLKEVGLDAVILGIASVELSKQVALEIFLGFQVTFLSLAG